MPEISFLKTERPVTLLGHRTPIFIYSNLLDHKLFNVFKRDFRLSFNYIILKKSLAPPPLHHSYCSSLFKQTHRTHLFLIAPSYLGPGNKALTQGTPHLPQEELSPFKKTRGEQSPPSQLRKTRFCRKNHGDKADAKLFLRTIGSFFLAQ